MINHFYHVYADGKWYEPVKEHINALKQSELDKNLSTFNVGIVGNEENRWHVKDYISEKTSCNFIVESETGWEQETMNKMREFIHENEGYIFYAHSKGSSDPSPINIAWRKSMIYFNIIQWRKALSYLENYDTVGCHWVTDPNDHKQFWGGNFWWATIEYLRTLPPIGMDNRWRAEGWNGITDKAKVYDMNPGWPAFNLFVTKW